MPVCMSSYLSRYGLVGEARTGKFNFGVGTRGGGMEMNLVEMEVWRRLDRFLGRVRSIPSDMSLVGETRGKKDLT